MKDALDRVFRKFGKKEKIEYAQKKREEELYKALHDDRTVKQTSKKFRDHIERERRRLGLIKQRSNPDERD